MKKARYISLAVSALAAILVGGPRMADACNVTYQYSVFCGTPCLDGGTSDATWASAGKMSTAGGWQFPCSSCCSGEYCGTQRYASEADGADCP